MQIAPYRRRLLLVGVFFLVVCSTVAYAQDVEHDQGESTKSEVERENDQRTIDVLEGRKHFLEGDLMFRSMDRSMHEFEHLDLPPTTFVNFGPGVGLYRDIEFSNNYTWGSFTVHDLDQGDDLYDSLDKIVLSGLVTQDDLDWFESRKLSVAYWTKYSANRDLAEAVAAVKLTSKTFNSNEVLLFDALPSERGVVRGRLELTRMGLTGQPSDWSAAREQIRAAAKGVPIHAATKSALVKELKVGTTTFLLVIAHSDSKNLYLPGVNGGRLSLSELQKIQRQDAPNRVIVLLACKTGKINNNVASIAEVILHNKLATAVLAANNYIYATDLSRMIATFMSSGKLSGAFPGLKTIVEREDLFQEDQSFRLYSQSVAIGG